jgi:hypothetical protein
MAKKKLEGGRTSVLGVIPQKMGVTWNLLIAVAYDNIGIFLRTGLFVP